MGNDVTREDRLALMKELTDAAGVPGQEAPVRAVVERHMTPLAEVKRDNLGSLVGVKKGSTDSPRIMFAGHLDEVGFMVSGITEKGYIRFLPLGGWWEQVMLAQRVIVRTHKGDELPGVIGSKPPHVLSREERKKPVKQQDMFIDIGATDKEDAEALGVRPGDAIIPVTPFTPMANPKLLMAKAWDNRAGCYVVLRLLQELQRIDHPNTVYGVTTVQEEVGLRGATTSADVVQPDVGFAVDVTIAGDTPGIKETEAQCKLGKGPALTLFDASMVPNTPLRDFVIDVASEAGIPFQYEAMPGGGTDAGRIHLWGKGVPSMVLSVPSRYIHSHASIVHEDDLERTVELAVQIAKRLDADRVAGFSR